MTASVKPSPPRLNPAQCKALYERADAAGKAAADACIPEPMLVQRADGYIYPPVMGGVCGFAWINIKPGNSSFARYIKLNVYGGRSDSYYGGVSLSVFGYGQSYERKHAYAAAFADVLSEAGIRAFAMSRLD